MKSNHTAKKKAVFYKSNLSLTYKIGSLTNLTCPSSKDLIICTRNNVKLRKITSGGQSIVKK